MTLNLNTTTEFTIKPHPNSEIFLEVTNAVKANEGYCCCEIEKNEDTKCMCKNFRDQENPGFCHCGRFFKVKEYPIITILCCPEDSSIADNIADNLAPQGFIILTPHYGCEYNYLKNKDRFDDLQFSQIFKADVIYVMNLSERAMSFLEEQIYWAEDLQKKIIYAYTEGVKANED